MSFLKFGLLRHHKLHGHVYLACEYIKHNGKTCLFAEQGFNQPILGFHLREKAEIKMETFSYRKSRIWEMKEDKYTKSLAKNQVHAIVHIRDIRKNVLPKFIKLCMERTCLCPFQGHKCGRLKPTETSVFVFSYLCVNSLLEEFIKVKVIFILRQGVFRQQNL